MLIGSVVKIEVLKGCPRISTRFGLGAISISKYYRQKTLYKNQVILIVAVLYGPTCIMYLYNLEVGPHFQCFGCQENGCCSRFKNLRVFFFIEEKDMSTELHCLADYKILLKSDTTCPF